MEEQGAQQRLSQAIIKLLAEDPLMGEVLINISREIIPAGDFTVDLVWQDDQLTLQVVAEQVSRLRDDELLNMLRHQALHLIWRHPVRYADHTQPALVNIACDVAVNQYLAEPPRGTMTLEQLRQILQRPLSAQQDSSYYLHVLQHLNAEQRQRLGNQTKKRKVKDPRGIHQGWFKPGNELVRTGRLERLIRQSNQRLTEQQRGLLPQPIQQELKSPTEQYQRPFRQAFWRLLGQVPSGYQPSRARFNRRQPQRLELPGRVTRLVTRLLVFIDQSGSMGDETISKIIELLNELARRADLEMQVGDFDAQIQTPPQTVNRQHQIRSERHGGGGTRYQAVFDYLAANHIHRQTPVVIVTDGWGEERINDHRYKRVLWLLTSDSPLSVQNVPTIVIRLEDRK